MFDIFVLTELFDPSALRAYGIFAIPVLVALLSMAVFHRANIKGLRIAGLLVGLADMALLLFIYITALIQLGVGGGFSDIVLALSAIPLAAVGSALVLALVLNKIVLSKAWLFSLAFGLVLAAVTQLFTQGSNSLQQQNWAGFFLLMAIALITVPLTILFCVFKNRRYQKVSNAASDA